MGALRLFLAAAALSIGACAATDHFQQRIDRYDLAAAESRDQMIFTNILRASRAEPLSFVQMGQITGSTTAAATVGLPSIILGPHIPLGTNLASNALQSESIFGGNPLGGSGYTGNSVTMNGSTNFQVTPSETKEFYNGLLAEVEPRTLEFFVQQGNCPGIIVLFVHGQADRGARRQKARVAQRSARSQLPRFSKICAPRDGLRPVERAPPGERRASKPDGGKTVTINLNDATAKSGDKAAEQKQWRLCFNPLYKSSNAAPAVNAPSCGDFDRVARQPRRKFRRPRRRARGASHNAAIGVCDLQISWADRRGRGAGAKSRSSAQRRSTVRRLTTTSCSSSRKARSPAVS